MDINKEVDVVIQKFKGLKYDTSDGTIYGEIFIDEYDSYEVKIDVSEYPKMFPVVFELGGRIPKKAHRHVYTDSGSCCFTTGARAQILLKTKISSLYLFVKEILVKYLENNSYYELNGKYFNGEYSHNSEGILEGYEDILGIKDINAIGRLVVSRINGGKLKIRDLCYCDSGITLKKCTGGLHDLNYRNFKMIDKGMLSYDLEHLKNVYNN